MGVGVEGEEGGGGSFFAFFFLSRLDRWPRVRLEGGGWWIRGEEDLGHTPLRTEPCVYLGWVAVGGLVFLCWGGRLYCSSTRSTELIMVILEKC